MLRFGERWWKFDRSGELSDIFYDNLNHKLCIVKGNGAQGIVVRDLQSEAEISFRIDDHGSIRIMKFSPDSQMLCIQYTENLVDFMCFHTPNSIQWFSQSIKMRTAKIMGVEWLSNNQIILVTNQGFELYQVYSQKKSSKLLKNCNISMNWYIYYANSQLLIAASGMNASIMNPFVVQNGIIHRLIKFEVDFGRCDANTVLLEREVAVASIYGSIYLLILRHCSRNSNASDIALYKLSETGLESPVISDILILERTGAFGIHVVDNVIVVHHQASRRSLIFDVYCCDRSNVQVAVHHPLAVTSVQCEETLYAEFNHAIPVYSQSWVMFHPNIVIDASIGLFSSIIIHPESSKDTWPSKGVFLHFLFNRTDMFSFFLDELRSALFASELNLKEVQKILRWIVEPMSRTIGSTVVKNPNRAVKYSLVAVPYEYQLFSQSEIISTIFLPISESSKMNKNRLIDYMLHYLMVLKENGIEVQQPHFLNEILVSTMISAGDFTRLHHCIQFRVIADTKQTAFYLLSFGAKYPPLIQLALDMLVRIGTATEEIVEVFLAEGRVVEAIRFLGSLSSLEKVNPLKLFEAAWQGDRQLRYAVYTKIQPLTSTHKMRTPAKRQYEDYLQRFNGLFTEREINGAKCISQTASVIRD